MEDCGECSFYSMRVRLWTGVRREGPTHAVKQRGWGTRDSTLHAMELPEPAPKGVVLRPIHLRSEALEIVRPGKMVPDPQQPHCADHAYFHSECVICKRACANFQPYPVRKDKPVSRSFGFTDNITEEKLRGLDPKMGDVSPGDPEFSISFVLLRALLRLIWPFKTW